MQASYDPGQTTVTGTDYKDASEWAVVARAPADLAPIADDPRWRPLDAAPGVRVWTDDYSDVSRMRSCAARLRLGRALTDQAGMRTGIAS